ncbi:MAG: hypothetical protein J6A28_01965 [Clostridia bacterium]|nr:hypothetical protein [Clostridia bacterium]
MLKYKVFNEDKEKGYNFPFILVYPQSFKSKVKLFVEGNNSVIYEEEGQQSFDAQQKYAEGYANWLTEPQDGQRFNMAYLYQQLNQPVVIPVIERCDNKHTGEFYTQMLGRNVVSEKTGKFANLSQQVVCMVREAERLLKAKGLDVEKKAGLIGMSTSGVFAGRMMFIHPEEFDCVLSVCSNAVQPLPLEELEGTKLQYPLGASDYQQLFGKEFNKEEYLKAKQLFIVGKDEPNEKYDIVKKSRLHDDEIGQLYLKVYGDEGIQARQQKIASILKDYDVKNVACVVAEGGHSLDYKGQLIMDWGREVLADAEEDFIE